jgi:DNA-binding SARP family transcriptional activator/tRNA A-37 threonylcarbamoyl transferase component Bud32
MLRLTTFGGVRLRRLEGDPAALAEDPAVPRRGLALLVLLAAAPEAGVSRDSIVACLWPESDDEHARNALRQTLFTLRRDLGLPDLLVGAAGLTLNPAALTSDVREFEHARAVGDLEQVARLYSGPFLEGFHLGGAPEFEQWADARRAELAARAAASLEELARRAGARGDPAAAAEWWRRLAASDPLNTRFVLESMLAQALAGNAAGALRQAQAHQALLRAELGTEPDRALGELVERIRNGGPILPPPSSPAVERASPLEPVAPAPRVAERFRDRLARELADRFVLEDAWEPGRGSSIRVLHARDRRHDRRVTLKVIHPALASQIDVERFVREIRLTGRLLHPHILPLLESGEVGGRPWFATPCHDGESLRSRLSREDRIPAEEAVRLARELAEALGYAHDHGVVHRDVSPENILLSGGHALLTNLGVARALDTAAGGALTDTGVLVGTAAYMSPEQARGDREVDARSDVYSLGAVLFEMLTGEPLFSGPTPQAIMAKRAAAATPGASRLEGLPSGLVRVLRRALTERPEDRYETIGELAVALHGALSAREPRRWAWRNVWAALRRDRR